MKDAGSKIAGALLGATLIFLVLILSYGADEDKEVNSIIYWVEMNNQDGLTLAAEDNLEEAITCFNNSISRIKELEELKDESEKAASKVDSLYNDTYNNLGYTYYLMLKYDLSLDNMEKALALKPDTVSEYVNMGNALYSLYNYNGAMQNYDKAIAMDPNTPYAYYGKGNIYYDQGEYATALDMFNKYNDIIKEADIEGDIIRIYCHIYLGNYDKAEALIDSRMSSYRDNYKLQEAKGELIGYTKSHEEAMAFYETMPELFPDSADAQMLLGQYHYENGDYKDALNSFLGLTDKFPGNGNIHSWIVYCYESMEEFDGMLSYLAQVEEHGNETYDLYNTIGNAHLNSYRYMESLVYYDAAIRMSPKIVDPYLNKLYGLQYGKRYTRCIEFGESVEGKFPLSYDIPWYIGEGYYYLNKNEEAITCYQRALLNSPDNSDIISDIAYSYLMLEEYDKAEEYARKSLELYPDNNTALFVKDSIRDRQNSIGSRLNTFIKDSYLYNVEGTDTSDNIDACFRDTEMTNSDIAAALEQVKNPEDIFSFTVSDEVYDYLHDDSMVDVEYNLLEDLEYLRIYGFNVNTDNKVIEILDEINDTENKTLVIDLRNNSGGLSNCANNILDVLLPECVTCTLIYRDGYTYNYYSDASQIKFRKIYIFIDENTASAAELMALGLKTYLNNVTIIGRSTFGKGVGQTVYEDKERKLMVFVVNHYWNVRQQNIMSTSVSPDIPVETEFLEDYLAVVREDN